MTINSLVAAHGNAWNEETTVCRVFRWKPPATERWRPVFDIVWDDPRCRADIGRDAEGPQANKLTCVSGEGKRASVLAGPHPRSLRPRAPAPGRRRRRFPGGHRSRVTPVPIPNTEVKPATADGTAWETAWESRSLPGLFIEGRICCRCGLFFFTGSDGQPRSAIGGHRPASGKAASVEQRRRAPARGSWLRAHGFF